jgi:pimeloyl-ACP methyl ester carboxylesterase
MNKLVALVGVLGCAIGLSVTACGANRQPSGAGQQSSGAGQQSSGTLRVRSCTVDNLRARCGTLFVPEDRLTGTGRTIPIRFVVMLAYGHHTSPDPIVDFAGGPGGSAVDDDVAGVAAEMVSLNESRDLVFIDQRGTGGSNGLTCPSPPGTLVNRAKLRASIKTCLASLRGKADLQFYTSKLTAEDVAQVLTALRYGQVNLFGASYGATEAQVFQRLYPARVRTMTLLGGSLLAIPVLERFPAASEQALDGLFARCAGDAACRAEFPHLAADWTKLRAAKWVNGVTLADGVHAGLMFAGTAAYLPLAIHSLLTTNGQPAALASLARKMSDRGLASGSGGSQPVVSYPIRCAEPWAKLTAASVTNPASYYYPASVQSAQWWQYVCPLIPTSGAASDYGSARVATTPVLMINGSADPQDPPANMAGAQQIWPNSRQIVEPGQSHNIDINSWMQCDGTLVQTFVKSASVNGLNTGCLAQVTLPAFATSW